jgi:hypothetical protein
MVPGWLVADIVCNDVITGNDIIAEGHPPTSQV